MAKTISIFHFPFAIYHIYHLSSGDARSPAHVKRQQHHANSVSSLYLLKKGLALDSK